jgi:hypothetical protein
MFRKWCRLLLLVAWLAGEMACGQTIFWSSASNAVNHTSGGLLPMDAGFRFELGVFTGAFVPTEGNKTSWAANWNSMQRSAYDVGEKRYYDEFTPGDNKAPFTEGKAVYVWGFRGDAAAGEWILFRANTWTVPNAYAPFNYQWFAQNATCVIGDIQLSGSPYLMKSAAVTNAAPPTTTWEQWQAEFLTNEPQNGPNHDPDKDGSSNLLEFVFGTPPKSAGAPVITPVSLVGGKLQISIPRRVDHPALLTVQVSGNLTDWQSGPAATQIVDDGVFALVVRDLTPLDPANPKRFMRLKAEPTGP